MTIVQSGTVIVYVVNGARLPDYLLDAYDYAGGVGVNSSLRFSLCDPFGSLWKNAYGFVFGES